MAVCLPDHEQSAEFLRTIRYFSLDNGDLLDTSAHNLSPSASVYSQCPCTPSFFSKVLLCLAAKGNRKTKDLFRYVGRTRLVPQFSFFANAIHKRK
jgi:hypothetical protein